MPRYYPIPVGVVLGCGRMHNAVQELLRFEAPGQFAARVARGRTQVEGAWIEPERIVSLGLAWQSGSVPGPRTWRRPIPFERAR